jgi:Zn-dependent metalloprotease
MISKPQLERLAADFTLPDATRRALRATIEYEDLWRRLRDLHRSFGVPRARLAAVPSLLVFDCNGTESLPGTLIDKPLTSSDLTARRAFSQTQMVAAFYKECFGRNSIDDAGKTLVSSIHFSRYYCNAYWKGDQMVYGDGDGMIFLDFTSSNDFIGHELTHGVTQYTAGLVYTDEPGALNESISDVFGSMFRQWVAKQSVLQADWLMGADLMGPTAHDHGWTCVRDLANPDAAHCLSRQPADYRHYIPGGDPHDNSGIANHAFFLAATAIGGASWAKTGRIWYSALTSKSATSTMKFKDFAKLTLVAVSDLFPTDTKTHSAIEQAWKSVGVIA